MFALFGFYTQQNVNSAANFVFTSKIVGLPCVLPVLQWVISLSTLREQVKSSQVKSIFI